MEWIKGDLVFYGHGVTSLVWDVILAANNYLLVYLFLGTPRKNVDFITRATLKFEFFGFKIFQVVYDLLQRIPKLIWGYVLFIYLPNSFYMCMEVRHALFIDGVADYGEPEAILVFGLLGFLGLFITIDQIQKLVGGVSWLYKYASLSVIFLSFASAWGALLGVYGLNPSEGFVSPTLIVTTTLKILSWDWVLLGMLLGTLLSILVLTTMGIRKETDTKPIKGEDYV